MSSDPFAPLKTWDGTSPGPWKQDHEYSVYNEDDVMIAHAVRHAPSKYTSIDDARHIAAWCPETCREVVGLLKKAVPVMGDALPDDAAGEWLCELGIFLSRLGAFDDAVELDPDGA
jgi:hypothetical protein